MLQHNVSLKKFNSWRVGGAAKNFLQCENIAELQSFLQASSTDENLLWLGLGSNLLIRDGGFAGTVIFTQAGLNKIELLDSGLIRAEAGVACAKCARFTARNELAGLEFLAGVPGTIGGALRMNAGCFDGETWNFVTAVETINRQGEIKLRPASDFEIAYRSVTMPEGVEEWFIAGHFKLPVGNKDESLAKIKTLLARRAATQPTGEHSCGSVFRNPPGDYAARLVEGAGLKGYSIGGARVSNKHANFIVNDADATAADIESLISLVQQKVMQQHGVHLIHEVHIVGEAL